MILANGKLYPSSDQNRILATLEEELKCTREAGFPPPVLVVGALSRLAEKARRGDYDELIASLGVKDAKEYLDTALTMLTRESLEFKLQNELGEDLPGTSRKLPVLDGRSITRRVYPLGTLFHIAAGNIDGLPAYSVAEGLLCGNINLLKLPMADQQVSISLLSELVRIEPQLAPYIYVFDTPSEDVAAIQALAAQCDGIVLWGGEAAETAVRRFAPCGVKLIEWGHKLSFAYVAAFQGCEDELAALAEHIIQTQQLLCSSCQDILLDTSSQEEIEAFCTAFFPILLKAAESRRSESIGERAERSLKRYTERLEEMMGEANTRGRHVGEDCGITISDTPELELSPMFGHVIVKGVARRDLVRVLRKSKGVLQTAGLICPEAERKELTELLFRSGVVKVTRAGAMSEAFIGESHDGEFPLRRYIRIVCEQD